MDCKSLSHTKQDCKCHADIARSAGPKESQLLCQVIVSAIRAMTYHHPQLVKIVQVNQKRGMGGDDDGDVIEKGKFLKKGPQLPLPLDMEVGGRLVHDEDGAGLQLCVSNPNAPKASIEEEDITGFNDLIYSVEGDSVGIFIISNGGSPSAAERIVKLIREKFTRVFFYVAGNAYSAATMMCFSGDGIVMLNQGTLGPIDPQINGRPAYAILKSFEEIQEKIEEGRTCRNSGLHALDSKI